MWLVLINLEQKLLHFFVKKEELLEGIDQLFDIFCINSSQKEKWR